MITMMTSAEAKTRISSNINRILRERGLSVMYLVKETGEPQNSIYRIARGDNEPTASLLAAIAEALGVTSEHLLAQPKISRNSA